MGDPDANIIKLFANGFTGMFPFFPLGLFLIAGQFVRAIVGNSSPLIYLLSMPFYLPLKFFGLLAGVIYGAASSIANAVLFFLKAPFTIVSAIAHLPLVISYFIFDTVENLVRIPFRVAKTVGQLAWRVIMSITYIPRLPFTIILQLPIFNLLPMIFSTMFEFAFTLVCTITGTMRFFMRFMFSMPARLLLIPYNIIRFMAMAPIRIIFFPFFAIDTVFTTMKNIILTPIQLLMFPVKFLAHLSTVFLNDIIGIPVRALYQVVSFPFSIPYRMIKGLMTILSVPHNFLSYIYS